MTSSYSVDPGARYVAIAHFERARFARCALIGVARPISADRPPNCAAIFLRDPCPDAIVQTVNAWANADSSARWTAETPRSYPGDRTPHADLADLRRVVAAIAEGKPRFKTAFPSEWKGNVPKAIHHVRCEAAAAKAGLAPAFFWALSHDERDAIALNLWALGLVGRGGSLVTILH